MFFSKYCPKDANVVPTEFSSEDVSCRLTKYLVLVGDDVNTSSAKWRRSFRRQNSRGHSNKAFDDGEKEQSKRGDTATEIKDDSHHNNNNESNEKENRCNESNTKGDEFEDVNINDDADHKTVPDKQPSDELSNSVTDNGTDYEDWRLSMDQFTSKRLGEKRKSSGLSRELRSFYKKQDDLVVEFETIRKETVKEESYVLSYHPPRYCNKPLYVIAAFMYYQRRKEKGPSAHLRKSFYKSQDNLIGHYEELRLDFDDSAETMEQFINFRKKASQYAKLTFFVNLLLLAIKIVAVVLSGSISLISSLVDSSVDLVSGVLIWITSRAVKKTDRYVYPQGRTKLEPVSIVILSVIMSVASLQIIKESFTKVVSLSNNSSAPPLMDWVTFGIASATVVLKLVLYLLCRRIPHPTIQALAQDHRNDVLSNAAAILFGYIGSQQMQDQTHVGELVYIDPVGAVVISIYIIVMWCITGWDQIKMLIGHTATPEFLSRITWVCMDHHKDIEKVDTVRAFHFGNHFLVEADIVLPPEMTLREAHDIGQPLQQKLERLPEVERAFVHIDYEYDHDPKTEHKVV